MLASFLKLAAYASALPIPGFLLPPPVNDSFYSAPPNLDSMQNGQVYNSRAILSNIEVAVTFASAEQIAYKTTNTQNNSSHSVATVYKPLKPDPEAKIFSYQVYEDSVNLDCAPSYSLAKGIITSDAYTVSSDTAISIDLALSKGWYVVVPDHGGARSTFIAGHEEGQAGLDGIKAAISYLGLNTSTPTALLGYSGGASATAWMASIQGEYAPELNIVGAAYGGTPVDLNSTFVYLDQSDKIFSGFIVPALGGFFHAYPEAYSACWPHLNEPLQNAITTAWKPGFCMLESIFEFMHQEWHTMTDINFLTFPEVTKVLGKESMLKNVSTNPVPVPKFPRYIWHADSDEIIPSGPVKQYVSEQCAEGANIQYVPWKGDDHVGVEYLGLPDALKFIIQAFENRTPNVTCGTANNDILTIGSTSLGDALGQVIADALNAISTVTTPLGNVILNITDGYQP